MQDRIAYQGITFDDVLLEPGYSEVVPKDVDVRTSLTRHIRLLRAARGLCLLTLAAVVLRRFSDQNLTLVDAVGLQMMKERKIRICWSTDFHLGLMGASLVIHEY